MPEIVYMDLTCLRHLGVHKTQTATCLGIQPGPIAFLDFQVSTKLSKSLLAPFISYPPECCSERNLDKLLNHRFLLGILQVG